MKPRSRFYIGRKKAQKEMRHPGDLRQFLIAEYNSSQNLVVKKDIMKMLDKLEQKSGQAGTADDISDASSKG